MDYIDGIELSDEAKQAFAGIFESLLRHIMYERKIPAKYSFVIDTSESHIVDELTRTGLIRPEIADGTQRVYSHTVDREQIRRLLGHDKH